MVPDRQQIYRLHKKYAWSEALLQDVMSHCEAVADIAMWCVRSKGLRVDEDRLIAACLLHDIGSYVFLSAKIEQRAMYPQHALFGATILQEEGVDEQICQAVRTHVLLGLTREEIKANNLVMPDKDFEPQTKEGRLLCYADRFSSKGAGLIFNSYSYFLKQLKVSMPAQAVKFEAWAKEFGIPDVKLFAEKYGARVRNN